MAIDIKSIPILKDEIAKKFVEKADAAYADKGNAIDFSQQINIADRILSKSKINKKN